VAWLCLAALLVRFRRSRGTQRQQLKWLLFACAVTIAIVLVVQPSTSSQWDLGMLLALPFFPAVPVAAGVAILRYRLYEIDRILNRTLVYGLLTAVLGLGYAAGSLLFVLVAGAGMDPPGWLVAAGTLVAAAVFRPIRGRIQAGVDRRFNRRRYHAAKTIEAFSARLRDEVDLDTLSAELVAVVDRTMEPTMASLWLRPSIERSERSSS
jgi:MFS family permease